MARGDPLLPGVKRPMGSDVRHVEKEWNVTGNRLLQELVGIVIEGVRHEEALLGKMPTLIIEVEVVSVSLVEVTVVPSALGTEESVTAKVMRRMPNLIMIRLQRT